MYTPKIKATDQQLNLRGLKTHLRVWGREDAPLLVLIHGWMDLGASFQFVVDHLQKDWRVVAPDMRGFGHTAWPVTECGGVRNYWYIDYLADLDALLDEISPDQPVNLVGHSMGGNIVMMYAGIRPKRVRSVVNLEGFGMLDTPVEKVPSRYATWLDQLKEPSQLRPYANLGEVAKRLQKTNYRLSDDKAQFLAQHWATEVAPGHFKLLGDPAHRIPSPLPYRLADVQQVWSSIEVPVLHVEASETEAALWLSRAGEPVDFDEFRKRYECVKDWRFKLVEKAGHMLHHDQPKAVAELIEAHITQ